VLVGVAILGASQLAVLLVLAGVQYAHVPVSFAGARRSASRVAASATQRCSTSARASRCT
jgi:hypothetical protein